MDRDKFMGRFINASLGALCTSFGLAISYFLYLAFAEKFGYFVIDNGADEIFDKLLANDFFDFFDFFREVYRFALERADAYDGRLICLVIFVVMLAVAFIDNVFNISSAWDRLKKSSERASDCTSGFELGLAFGLGFVLFVPAWFFGFLGWIGFMIAWIAYLSHPGRRYGCFLNNSGFSLCQSFIACKGVLLPKADCGSC